MQAVSTEWKEAQLQRLVPESFVEITLALGDPESQDDSAPTANGEEAFSNAKLLTSEIDKNPSKYVTIEHNIWVLDGSLSVTPDSDYGEQGYIGNWISDANGYFSDYPTITISFSRGFTKIIPGVTIMWGSAYDEWADSFIITAYSGDEQTAQIVVTGNKDIKSFSEFDIEEYDKIVIEITKWSIPYRRARIQEIFLGLERVYSKSDVMGYTHTMIVDPLSATLPKDEIVFYVANIDGEYNPDNPSSYTKYLMERQELTARYGYKLGDIVEWIPAGLFFLSSWNTPQNGITTSFTARDALEFMEAEYTGATSGTLYDIAESAMLQADLPLMPGGSVRWDIDESLKEIEVPPDVEFANISIMVALQYCANAACCVLYQSRDGMLHIVPLESGKTDYSINRFNSYENSELSLSKELKSVNINNGQYILLVGDKGVEQPISNPLISDDRAPIVAEWISNYLQNRQSLTGQFRADPRLDPLDRITNVNQFSKSTVLVSEFQITYNGAFRGSYTGRRNA